MFFTFTSSAVESSGLSVCRFMNPLCDAALCRSAPIHHTLQFYAKCEQRSFCSAQNPTSFGVKLAYGVVFAGNPSKEKARNFSVHQEVSGFVLLKLELVGARPLHLAGARPLGRLKAPLGLSLLRKRGIYCSIGFIVGNSSTSRMEALSVSSITRRSTPKPRPPVGGRPYSSAFT